MSTNNNLTLYQIEEHLLALLDTEEMVEDETARLQILDEIGEAGKAAVAKRDNVIRFLRHVALQVEAVKVEIDRLTAFKKSYLRGKERVEHHLVGVIERFAPKPKGKQKAKLEGTIGVLTLRKLPDRLFFEDEALVPAKFCNVTVKMDGQDFQLLMDILRDHAKSHPNASRVAEAVGNGKSFSTKSAEIKKALQAGEEVEGADLAFGENKLVVK
jgi:hypothetical protein